MIRRIAFIHTVAMLVDRFRPRFQAELPRWFDEGYATWVSGGWDESSGWQIRLALLRGQAPPLDDTNAEPLLVSLDQAARDGRPAGQDEAQR